jgi:outer membrane protein assembly factor BamB
MQRLTGFTPIAFVLLAMPAGLAPAAEPWSTHRGNLQRTGNTDGVAGPRSPHILWVHRGQDHFIAPPVVAGDLVLFAGLGGFNVPTLYALAAEPKPARRVVWSKTTPLLKLPVVSSPAVAGDQIYFGDGMHQTDGAILHCLHRQGGLPLWQLPVPGKLVHLEGSPTFADGRVFIGGGAAGVLCVDAERVSLDGQEHDLPSIRKILDQKWQALVERYEADRKKDPDFAVPPSEDQLPKPAPRRLWQQGQDRWHVDAPLAVAGNRVLGASAYLDKERTGERVLFCLDVSTGSVVWQSRLRLNPWGGPSLQGDLVVVGGSTIGYDPRQLKGARGEIAAFDLRTGQEKWRKDVPGGVLSSVALAEGMAIATATDGKVRAFDLATGERRWIHEARVPFFAAPAVAGRTVYVGDLRGGLHALSLATGEVQWKLDLGGHPDSQSPGMIYGGPVLHGGRLFVATCNVAEGPYPNQPTVIVSA